MTCCDMTHSMTAELIHLDRLPVADSACAGHALSKSSQQFLYTTHVASQEQGSDVIPPHRPAHDWWTSWDDAVTVVGDSIVSDGNNLDSFTGGIQVVETDVSEMTGVPQI